MVWSYAETRMCRVKLGNDGDDCVVFVRKADLAAFMGGLRDWFLGMGFNMKIDYVTDQFEQIKFCQSSPVFIDNTWRMIRSPEKALSGDTWSTKVNNDGSMRAHLGAVGVCGGVLSTGVPIFQAYYEAMRRNGNVERAKTMLTRDTELLGYGFTRMAYETSHTFEFEVRPISPESRVSFWRAFGITPDQQVIIEKHYSEISIGPVVPHRLEISHLQFAVRTPSVPNCFLTQYGR